jgi:hypothetical protein
METEKWKNRNDELNGNENSIDIEKNKETKLCTCEWGLWNMSRWTETNTAFF